MAGDMQGRAPGSISGLHLQVCPIESLNVNSTHYTNAVLCFAGQKTSKVMAYVRFPMSWSAIPSKQDLQYAPHPQLPGQLRSTVCQSTAGILQARPHILGMGVHHHFHAKSL